MMWVAVLAAGAIVATLAIMALLRGERRCPACGLHFPCSEDMHYHLNRRHLS